MNYLMDTHYLLWVVFEKEIISKKIGDIITDPVKKVFVSTVSFWEISLKSSLGKIEITRLRPGGYA